MANIKQQIKRKKTDAKKKLTSRSFLSSVKTAIKKAEKLIGAKSDNAVTYLRLAKKKIDKLVTKGIKKKNFVNRKKSQLDKKMNEMTEEQTKTDKNSKNESSSTKKSSDTKKTDV